MAVSIKVITADKAQDAYFRAAFRNEVRAVAGLDHPGVVLVLDYGEVPFDAPSPLSPGCPYLVMEHASGGSLGEAPAKPFVWPEIRTILTSLLGALAHAHARGVIHRDLKPGNVLICQRDDPRPGLKLTDFGLARHLEEHDAAGNVEAVRGTLHYMSPEQCRGLWREQGPWTDLYAVGCIAYQLATGRPPFRGLRGEALMRAHVQDDAPPLPHRRGLPEGYARWVARLLNKAPRDRYDCAADAAWALSLLPEPEDVGPTKWIFPDLAETQGLSDDLETDPKPRTPIVPEEDPPQPRRGGADPREVPPVPNTWRQPAAPPADVRLLGAGLGLFDLRSVALVGRVVERDILWESLRHVAGDGQARCVVLAGPNGSGLSRLASWVGSRAHQVGAATVLLLESRPDDPPLAPVSRMLARLTGVVGLPRLQARVRVTRFAERVALSPIDAEALLALLYPADRGRGSNRRQRYALIRRVLACLGRKRAVVVRAEDLQWGGDAVGLIRYLLDQSGDEAVPVLVIGTVRDDSDAPLGEARLAQLDAHARVRVLRPGRLTAADMHTLLHGNMALSSTLSLRVQEICNGNPLFAVQLVGDWARRGLLIAGEGGFSLRPGAAMELPDGLHETWDARVVHALAGLPPRAAAQLERAAVLGEEFDVETWRAACALDDPPGGDKVQERLIATLLDARLLRQRRNGLRFEHTLLRQSVLRRARESGRLEDHHHACAKVLEPRADGSWQLAEALGRHRYAAGDRAGALQPLLEAAGAWRRAGGHQECLALVSKVEDILAETGTAFNDPRQVQVMHLRIVCHQQRGERAEARAWVQRALALTSRLDRPTDRALLRLDAVQSAYKVNKWEQAERLMALARTDLAHVADPDLVQRAAFVEGHLARGAGRLDEAEAHLTHARELAAANGRITNEGNALRDLGVIAWLRGDVHRARAFYDEGRKILEEAQSLKDLAAALNNLGECSRALGNLAEAEEHYRSAIDLFARAGASEAAPYPASNLGLVLVATDRHQEALTVLTRALNEIRRQENPEFEATVRAVIAPCCAALGDWPGWARQLDRLSDGSLPAPHPEPELADALREGARRAAEAARLEEAKRGYVLAAQVYLALDRGSDAAACTREAHDLDRTAG